MPETKRLLKVFLCHARADSDSVRTLYLRLTRDGVDAWLDKEKLIGGQDWEYEIRRAVRESDVVVVCLSRQFAQKGFRQYEVRIALEEANLQPEGEIFIIPLRLEDCNVPQSLLRWQWVDLFEEDGYPKFMKALKERELQLKRASVRPPGVHNSRPNQTTFLPLASPSRTSIDIDDIKNPFSRIIRPIAEIFFSPRVLICGFLGVFVGGFTWNILNNLLGWPYFLGGPGNEPYGFSALVWGSIVVFPVAFFAYSAFYESILANLRIFLKALGVVMLYTIFGGIGAVIFYNSGFRNYIIQQNLGYGTQELIIVSVWAFVISLIVSLPVLSFSHNFKDIVNIRIILLQILFCVVFSFLAVVVSLFIRFPETQVAVIRGFLAGLGLRFGLFVGIVASFFLRPNARK